MSGIIADLLFETEVCPEITLVDGTSINNADLMSYDDKTGILILNENLLDPRGSGEVGPVNRILLPISQVKKIVYPIPLELCENCGVNSAVMNSDTCYACKLDE